MKKSGGILEYEYNIQDYYDNLLILNEEFTTSRHCLAMECLVGRLIMGEFNSYNENIFRFIEIT